MLTILQLSNIFLLLISESVGCLLIVQVVSSHLIKELFKIVKRITANFGFNIFFTLLNQIPIHINR